MPKGKKHRAHGSEPAAPLKILLRNGVTGEDLVEVTVNAAHELTAVVEKNFPDLIPFDLIYNGSKMADLRLADNLPDGATVDLLRRPKPKSFEQVARLKMNDMGYHCHDTYLDRICCEDPSSFVVSFQRFFRGDDFTSYRTACCEGRYAEHKAFPPQMEVVTLNLAQCSDEDVKSVYRGPDDGRTIKLMAIALDGTRYFKVNGGLGSSTKLCRSSGEESTSLTPLTPLTPLYTFPANLVPLDCLFVGSSLFIVGIDGDELWILELDGDGTERRLQRLGDLPGEVVTVQGRMLSTSFLGLDDTQEALWLITPKCLVTLQLSSLEAHVCCLSSDLSKREPDAEDGEAYLSSRGIVLNPKTREIFLHFDASLLFNFFGGNERGRENVGASATCFLRCLRPEQLGKDGKEPQEWEVVYPEKAELVGGEMFTIDGFSDSFCISRCHVVKLASADSNDSERMRLLTLDAEGGLWQTEL